MNVGDSCFDMEARPGHANHSAGLQKGFVDVCRLFISEFVGP